MTAGEVLTHGAAQLGMEVGEDAQKKMLEYLTLLQKWNQVYSLTAVRQPERMVSNHLLDSLAVLPHLWPGRWLDVGSGAGLPGLVLALMRPDWAVTLLDSNSKKTGFMQQAAIELGLDNVTVCCARAESWHPVQKYDGIISRAFASLADFTHLTRHLLHPAGKWAAMKGAPEAELECLPLGINVEQLIPLHVPGVDAARCLVILKSI